MQTEAKLPNGIINPFSELFLSTWQLWKDFRWQEHKFKYKGCISEQLALVQLAQKSGKDEQTAIQIIYQSIENCWSGLYPLKTVKINGTEKKPTDNASTRQSLNDLYSQRFGKQ
jgi:hypothetical protein